MAQSVKFLSHRHQDLRLIPKTNVKTLIVAVCTDNLSVVEDETGESRGSLASHPA